MRNEWTKEEEEERWVYWEKGNVYMMGSERGKRRWIVGDLLGEIRGMWNWKNN
jgi:hypothetical protein